MFYKVEYQKRAHQEVEKIFRVLLPEQGLAVREEQIRLCHEMLDALQLQAGMVDKRRKILDMAMDSRILQLEQQVAKLKRENETLRKENEAMRKALNKRDLNLIKNF